MTTRFARSLGALALAATTASAAPFLSLGDGSEVLLTGTVALESNSNLTLTEQEVSDTVFEVAPGLAYVFGRNALTRGSLTYVESITRYAEHDEFEAELSNFAFDGTYAEENSAFNVYASFVQLNQNTVDVRNPSLNQLARRDVTRYGGDGEWEMTPKIKMSVGFDSLEIDYKRPGFVDKESTRVPFDVYYAFRPKLDLSLGFSRRETDLDGTFSDRSDTFYNLGARGQFTPKLEGRFQVGFTQRDFVSGNDRDALGLASDFTYRFSEKTRVTFGASNDFGESGTGESQENRELYVGARSALSPEFGVSARVYYRSIDYFAQPDDDYLEGQLVADYTVNRYLTISGSAVYRENESDFVGGDFEATLFRLAAHLRY